MSDFVKYVVKLLGKGCPLWASVISKACVLLTQNLFSQSKLFSDVKVTHSRTELTQGLFVFSATLGVIGHSLGAA